MTAQPLVPSRAALSAAVERNRELGHENFGFLSEEHGLAPSQPPLLQMPPSHRAWDQIVAQFPELFRTLRLRKAAERLPVLSATPDDLAEGYLLRASALLSMLAHAYVRVQTDPPQSLPASIQRPWEEVSARLHRRAPVLSYIDLIIYNWQFRDPATPDPMRVENLDLLIPTVGNQEERVFHLTQVEILAQCAPIVGAIVRAQEAVVAGDIVSLERELLSIIERLRHVTEVSFLKIDPNPRSATFVDPAIWAKTVAPFAVPITPGVQGPSGTSSPIFHLMDIFLGRTEYQSVLGVETLHIRGWYPQHWLSFLEAVGQVSLRDFVAGSGDPRLQGVFQALVDAYAGDKGFLGVHRLKVYGYLETAFKLGRSVTIGGFHGLFKDRTWKEVDGELVRSRDERLQALPAYFSFGVPTREPLLDRDAEREQPEIRLIQLNVAGAGIHYRPGDRCGVLPENSVELIDKTLRALRASGEEIVKLDRTWQRAVTARAGHGGTTTLPLATLLQYGKLRPVPREVAKVLRSLTASTRLKQIIDARAEDQWELWDLLDLIYAGGFDTRRLWKAEPWEAESICKIVPPETYRLYSISSAMEQEAQAGQEHRQQIDLTVRRLEYETRDSDTSQAAQRQGSASNYLHRIMVGDGRRPHVPLRVSPALRFHLPDEPTRPIVMFASGSGIAPFRSFLHERTRQAEAGENWLFFGTRTPEEFFFRDEIERWVEQGQLHLRIAFSAADVQLRQNPTTGGKTLTPEAGQRRRITAVMEEDENAGLLWELARGEDEGGKGAVFYVCGQTGFAVSVMNTLRGIMQRFSPGDREEARATQARERFYRLVADRRYLQDIYTTYPGPYHESSRAFHASDVALHNNHEQGYWCVIDGRVYDLTEFINLHPGGRQILRLNAGTDATRAYQGVLHHLNTEVDAMLGMYEIGHIRRLRFNERWGLAVGPAGLVYISVADAFRAWVRFLYLIVEMENALSSDFSVSRRVTTEREPAAEMTPLKIQIVAETHKRFVSGYLDALLGDELLRLWAITSGLCASHEDVQRLAREIEEIETSPDALLTRQCGDIIEQLLDQMLASEDIDQALFSQMIGLCSLLGWQDRGILSRLKLAVREGVMAFEQYESRTVELGGQWLIEILLLIPTLLREYYAGVAAGMRAAKATVTAEPALKGRATGSPGDTQQWGAQETQRVNELPGHGTVIEDTKGGLPVPASKPSNA